MKNSKRHIIYISGIVLLLPFIYPENSLLFARHDNSLRIDQNFNGTIDDRFQLICYVFEQINDNISRYDYIELGTGLQYQTPLSWLSLLVYYQQSYSQDDGGDWLLEQKPSMNINTSVTYSHFKFTNQIRYEYRITPEWHDYRIKNYLVISLHDIFLQPYTGWELFYENRAKSIMLNRIKFGINKNVYSNIHLGVYYRIDFSKINRHWEFSRQLIGFQFALKY